MQRRRTSREGKRVSVRGCDTRRAGWQESWHEWYVPLLFVFQACGSEQDFGGVNGLVVWVPDPNLLKLETQGLAAPDQVLGSLEDFVPEEWGLPPYDSD